MFWQNLGGRNSNEHLPGIKYSRTFLNYRHSRDRDESPYHILLEASVFTTVRSREVSVRKGLTVLGSDKGVKNRRLELDGHELERLTGKNQVKPVLVASLTGSFVVWHGG